MNSNLPLNQTHITINKPLSITINYATWIVLYPLIISKFTNNINNIQPSSSDKKIYRDQFSKRYDLKGPKIEKRVGFNHIKDMRVHQPIQRRSRIRYVPVVKY